jgi:chromosome partitioning protein
VQKQKSLHTQTMQDMREAYPKRFVPAAVPFSTDIEKMGVNRAPVQDFASSKPAAKAYEELFGDVLERIGA